MVWIAHAGHAPGQPLLMSSALGTHACVPLQTLALTRFPPHWLVPGSDSKFLPHCLDILCWPAFSPVTLALCSYPTWFRDDLGWLCADSTGVFYKNGFSALFQTNLEGSVFPISSPPLLFCSLRCVWLKAQWRFSETLVLNSEPFWTSAVSLPSLGGQSSPNHINPPRMGSGLALLFCFVKFSIFLLIQSRNFVTSCSSCDSCYPFFLILSPGDSNRLCLEAACLLKNYQDFILLYEIDAKLEFATHRTETKQFLCPNLSYRKF